MMRWERVCVHEFGAVLPPVELSSAAIEEQLRPVYERLKLPAGRLELMTGIGARRLWEEGTRPSDGATEAGRLALARSGVPQEAISCLLFTSVSRDMMEPATAAFVHRSLGLPDSCLLFDISNACLGFLDGMVMLANMLELVPHAEIADVSEPIVAAALDDAVRSGLLAELDAPGRTVRMPSQRAR